MPLSAHEVSSYYETFFSLEPSGDTFLPTLWDNLQEGSTRAVCLIASDGRVEIHTDPYIVSIYLDDEPTDD
jgi:hypothetical protein